MKRTLASACYLLWLTFMLGTIQAQVAIGTPRFSSLGGGPFDSVNLGNLNVHFVIPIVHKAGRGLSFNYNLSYDSSIWQPVTSNGTTSWKNMTDTSWGWTSSIPRGGHVTARSITIATEDCLKGTAMLIETIITYSHWAYFDGFGTAHPFSGSSTKSSGCTTNSTGFSATATDNSGYSITISGNTVTSLIAIRRHKNQPCHGSNYGSGYER